MLSPHSFTVKEATLLALGCYQPAQATLHADHVIYGLLSQDLEFLNTQVNAATNKKQTQILHG